MVAGTAALIELDDAISDMQVVVWGLVDEKSRRLLLKKAREG